MPPIHYYRPDIDALRAIAVLPVVLFHLDKSWIPGGYLGVDVFFVISGFLITRLLAAELGTGKLDFIGFWRRRALRILPALVVMVAVTFILGHWLLFAPERYDLAINSTAALLSFSNITHWLNYGGYWGADASASPLLHTWSLGVEEQFYLLYPILLWLVWRWLRESAVPVVLAIAIFASLCLFLFGLHARPSATFYLLPTRAWELGAGALAATVKWDPSGKPLAAKGLAWSGLALVLCSYVFASPAGLGYWSIAAVAGAALIVGAGTDGPFRSIGLTSRSLVFVGLLSYSLYLWHWPLIILAGAAEIRFGFVLPFSLLLLLMVAISYCSWRFVETPMRRGKQYAPSIAAAAVVLALVMYGLRGVNNAEDASGLKPTQWAGNEFNVNPIKEWPESVKRRMEGMQVSGEGNSSLEYSSLGIVRRYGGEKIDVLMLGDSHGLMWAAAVDEIVSEARKTISFMTADGTSVFFEIPVINGTQNSSFTKEELTKFRHAVLGIIRDQRPPVVVIGASWINYSPVDAKSLLDEIAKAGSRTLLIQDAPVLDIGDRNAHQFVAFLGVDASASGEVWVEHADLGKLEQSRKSFDAIQAMCGKRCDVVRTEDLYFRERNGVAEVLLVNDGAVLYIDDDHLSVAGAQKALGRIRSALNAQFLPPPLALTGTKVQANAP